MTPFSPMQRRLIGALIGLIRSVDGAHEIPEQVQHLVQVGLVASAHSDSTHEPQQEALLRQIAKEKHRLVPDCSVCPNPCGRHDDYDIQELWSEPEDIRLLKLQLLTLLQQSAVNHPEQTASSLAPLFTVGEEIDKESLLPYLSQLETEHR